MTLCHTHHALQDFSEHHVLPIQPWSLNCGDKELGAIGVLASVGHAEPAGPVVLQLEVLVRETVSIDALAFKEKKVYILAISTPSLH